TVEAGQRQAEHQFINVFGVDAQRLCDLLLADSFLSERREHLLQHLRNLTGSAIRLFLTEPTRRDLDIELAILPFRQKIESMEAVRHPASDTPQTFLSRMRLSMVAKRGA